LKNSSEPDERSKTESYHSKVSNIPKTVSFEYLGLSNNRALKCQCRDEGKPYIIVPQLSIIMQLRTLWPGRTRQNPII
jgi:hypothetical protein